MLTLSVLLVEDDPDDLRLIQEILDAPENLCRYRIRHASSRTECEQMIREEPPDVILVDLNLPDSRGLETVENILWEAPESAVIAVTGVKEADLALTAIQSGAQEYVYKDERLPTVLPHVVPFAYERKRMQASGEEGGSRDPITELLNFGNFMARLRSAISVARRQSSLLCLGYFRFGTGAEMNLAEIRERLGARGTNTLLRDFASRITDQVDSGLDACRVHASSYVAVLHGDNGPLLRERMAAIEANLARPFFIEGVDDNVIHRIDVRVMLGTSMFPDDVDGPKPEQVAQKLVFLAQSQMQEKGGGAALSSVGGA